MTPEQLNVAKDLSYRMSRCIQRNAFLDAWEIGAQLEMFIKRCKPPADRGIFDHVIYHDTDGGKKLTHRQENDELFMVKIRDYTLPIPCFKHVPKTVGRAGPWIHYYQARGDGLITATYYESQVVTCDRIEPTCNLVNSK